MKRFTIFISLIFAFCTFTASAQTKVIAHRGYWDTKGSAQNSIKSLNEACRIGCYGSECDVWLTKDGVTVVTHDHIIVNNETGEKYIIEETPYDVIKNIKLSNGETLSTFPSYIESAKKCKKTKLIIELKSQGNTPEEHQKALAEKVVQMVNKAGMKKRVEYIAFSLYMTKAIISLDSKAKVAYLNGDLTPAQLAEIGCSGLDYNLNTLRKNTNWLDEAKKLGLTVNVWTVNNPEDMRYFIEQGADFITTDKPEILQQLISEQR